MKKYIIVSVLGLFIFTISCKKEKVNTIVKEIIKTKPNNYYPMTVGSYWIYEFKAYYIEDWSATGSVSYDTLRIIKDTIIHDDVFYCFENTHSIFRQRYFSRDSAGYIVNQSGTVRLVPEPTPDILYNEFYSKNSISGDTTFHFWSEMNDNPTVNSMFGAKKAMEYVFIHENYFLDKTYYDTTYYSEIGPLQRSFTFASGVRNRGLLLEYHLE